MARHKPTDRTRRAKLERAGAEVRRWNAALASALGIIHNWRWPLKCALGAALGLAGLALRLSLNEALRDQILYFTFYPSVAIAAFLGGLLPGTSAALVGLFAAQVWPWAIGFGYPLRTAVFIFYSFAICGLAEAMHRAFLRLGEAEGRRAEAEKLLIARERFRLADTAGAIGTCDLDIEKDAATDADSLRKLFGLAPGTVVNPAQIVGIALPEDAPKIKAALQAAFEPTGDGVYQADYRIRRPSDGAERWIAARGQVFFKAGQAIRMIGVSRDVTEERTTRQALLMTQAQVRAFVERAPISIAMLDRRMTYTAASRRWTEAYGRGHSDLVGRNHYAIHPDIPDRWRAIHQRVLKGEFHTEDDDRWVDADGEEHWVRWAAFPWIDVAGEIGGIIMFAEETARQKRAEAALRESEERFRNAFADAAIGFVMAKARGHIIDANAAYCRLTGYSVEELRSMRPVDFIHPEDKTENLALVEKLYSGAVSSYVVENRCLRRDGQSIWVRKSVSLTRNSEGEPRWVVNLVEDVTGRKRSEEAAARTVAQLSAVLDGAPDAIISIDETGIIQSVNAPAMKMFGYHRGEVVGCNVRMLMPEYNARRHDDYIANYLRTGVGKIIGVGREVEGQRKDGALFPIELAIVEAAVDHSRMFVGFLRDLSERRRIETRIDDLASQRLIAMGGMAGALAHELNQPLAAMGVYLETARRMLGRPPEQRPATVEEALRLAAEQVMRMGDIVNHLREFVAHGDPDKTHQNLHALIREVFAAEFPGHKSGLPSVSLNLGAMDDEVLVDRVQIGQVLTNLVRNAREATMDSANARIAISTAPNGSGMIRCDVSDNGPGLSHEIRDRLFEPLTTTKATGMGIGLSISKAIIETHYGKIWAEPNPGGGTVFSFTLPLSSVEGEE